MFRVLLNERSIICIIFVDGIDEDRLLPLLSTLPGELIVIEEVGGQHCLGLDPAVFTGDDLGGSVVLGVVTSYASINGFFDDRDLVLVRTRYS